MYSGRGVSRARSYGRVDACSRTHVEEKGSSRATGKDSPPCPCLCGMYLVRACVSAYAFSQYVDDGGWAGRESLTAVLHI